MPHNPSGVLVPPNFYRVAAKAIIFDENKRFLLFCENDGSWDLPGGGIDYGETPEDCLKRELMEEGGLEVIWVKNLPSYFYNVEVEGLHWKALIAYEARVKNLDFIPSDECVAVEFFTKEEALKKNLFSGVKEFLNFFDLKNH